MYDGAEAVPDALTEVRDLADEDDVFPRARLRLKSTAPSFSVDTEGLEVDSVEDDDILVCD